MPQIIPLTNRNAPTITTITLGDSTYSIRMYWNEYVSRWYLDISTSTREPLALGIPIVANINLLRYSKALTARIGQLRAVDTTGGDCEIQDNIGTRIKLLYFSPGEFEALPRNQIDLPYRPINYPFSDLFRVIHG